MNVVMIVWRDIMSLDSEDNSSAWFTKEQIMTKAKDCYNDEHFSVGEIVGETNDFIILAATTDKQGLYSDASMIPKALIIRKYKV